MTDQFHSWQQIPRHVFAPLTADNRTDYLAVLACFEAAVFEPALNLEALSSRLASTAPHLAGDDTALAHELAALVRWGLLEESRDDSVTYSDPTEFRRRHIQWSLTHHGQATNAAADAAFDRLRSSAALQPAVIDTIAAALSEVADWLTGPGATNDAEIAALVHVRLFDAENHHRSLVDNLRTFTREVTRALGRPDLDDGGLAEAKDHIVGFLNRYVVSSEAPARNVAAALDRLEVIGFDVVAAAATEGSNLAPGLDGIDPRPAARAARRANLDALHQWFRGADGPPTFSELLPRGRDAILSFLRVLGIRREVARRNASITEDFRALARAFHRAASDGDAHRLWSAATGMAPSRHHQIPADDAERAPSRGNPASLNPPAELEIELRRRPRSTGRPAHARPVPDASGSRAAAQAREAVALAAVQSHRAALATDGPTRLSAFDQLPLDTYEVFADLLSSALATPCEEDRTRRTRSTDGHVEVVLGDVDAHARAHRAWIRTTTGTLDCPDLTISISILGRAILGPAVRPAQPASQAS